MEILHPNKEEFKNLIKGEELVVVDFFATWCGPCKMYAPILEEFAKNNTNVKIAKIDIDENEDLSMEYNIQAVPTTVLFKKEHVMETKTGVISLEELENMIEKNK